MKKTTPNHSKPTTSSHRKKKRKESFSIYIYKILKDLHSSNNNKGITRKAMEIMNSMIFDIFEKITNQSCQLMRYTKRKTLSVKEIETCVRLLFPYELGKHTIQEARKSVEKFKNYEVN